MPDPTILSYTIQDSEGVKAVSNYYTAYDGATLSLNGANSNWAALGGLIDAITDGVIIGGGIKIPLQPSGGWKTSPTNPTQVANGGMFDMNQANIKYVQEVLIPAFATSKITSGRINLADTDVAAFIAAITSGAGLYPLDPMFVNSKYLNALESLRDAFLNTRKHRRQLVKSSFEV